MSRKQTGHNQTRREFLQDSAALGVAFWVGGNSLPAADKSPNEKLNIACIGVGGKGSSDTNHAGALANVVAICDIDDNTLGKKAETFPAAKKYNDFRKMLEELDRQIDAVTVSTPDHTHAPAAMMAMKMGKHVYCQKPLTHSVHEARALREAAAKYHVATQMGNQGIAENGQRRAMEVVQSGVIGPIREVHVWTDRPIWPQAPKIVSRPSESVPVPSHVHWDLFLGPAPERPYNPAYHPFKWRGWWDFGTGALGDMACHEASMPFMALKLGYPTSVVAESSEINRETCPAWATIHYEFPARGDLAPVRLTWYEGKKDGQQNLPAAELAKGEKIPDNGLILVGDKGTMFCPDAHGAVFKLLPEKDFEGYQGPPETFPRNGGGDEGMKREWIAACKGGPPALSNFEYSGLLTETVLLGNVALRVGKKIEWDGPNMRVTNCPEAAQYIQPEYRKGWTL